MLGRRLSYTADLALGWNAGLRDDHRRDIESRSVRAYRLDCFLSGRSFCFLRTRPHREASELPDTLGTGAVHHLAFDLRDLQVIDVLAALSPLQDHPWCRPWRPTPGEVFAATSGLAPINRELAVCSTNPDEPWHIVDAWPVDPDAGAWISEALGETRVTAVDPLARVQARWDVDFGPMSPPGLRTSLGVIHDRSWQVALPHPSPSTELTWTRREARDFGWAANDRYLGWADPITLGGKLASVFQGPGGAEESQGAPDHYLVANLSDCRQYDHRRDRRGGLNKRQPSHWAFDGRAVPETSEWMLAGYLAAGGTVQGAREVGLDRRWREIAWGPSEHDIVPCQGAPSQGVR